MLIFSDNVKVYPVTLNVNTGEQIIADERSAIDYPAYIETSSKVAYTSNGMPYTVNYLIYLPKTASVKEGDLVKITKLFGNIISGDLYKIKTVSRCGFLSLFTHIEVTI